jgi:hypothetical protein
MLQAPLQGDDIPLFLLSDAYHTPGTALANPEGMPEAPLSAFWIGVFWKLGNGSLTVVRGAGLLLHALGALLLYLVVRVWTGRRDSVVAPMLAGLLLGASPAASGCLALLHSQPMVLAMTASLASALFFLLATPDARKTDELFLVLAGLFQLMAFAFHHSAVLLPVVLLFLKLTRFRTSGTSLRLSWLPWLALVAVSLSLSVAVPLSPSAWMISGSGYAGSAAAALLLGGLLVVLPSMPRMIATAIAVLLVLAGAVVSFQQGMQYVDPLGSFEQQSSKEAPADPAGHALQFLAAADKASTPEEQYAFLLQARELWGDNEAYGLSASEFRHALGKRLLQLGRAPEASEMLEPLLALAPFEAAGTEAALALARSLDEQKQIRQIADWYGWLKRRDALPREDVARYARMLLLSGDVTGSAALYAGVPELDENTVDGALKKQALAARNAAYALQETARKKVLENTGAVEGYIASGESNLISGNMLRAFYWLELAMRKDPKATRPWELAGIIFARHNQAEQFVQQWGSHDGVAKEVWLSLARQAALTQAWESALVYADQAVMPEGPSGEEYLAAFAAEMKRISVAEEWLKRAAEKRPEAPGPWLYLCDFAHASKKPEEAQRYLEEAKKRNASPEEVQKRIDRLNALEQGAAPEKSAEPVRTYMQ